jgi:hypothetical protein
VERGTRAAQQAACPCGRRTKPVRALRAQVRGATLRLRVPEVYVSYSGLLQRSGRFPLRESAEAELAAPV